MKMAPNTKTNDGGAEEPMRCIILRRDFGMRGVFGGQRVIGYYIHFWRLVIDEI